MSTRYVYLLTCTVNGKGYVGITESTLEERWALHVASSRCPKSRAYRFMSVVRAIAKHGPGSFTRKVIEICSTVAAMNEAEARWIVELGTQDPSKGYNLTAGGEATMKGRKHSAEAKARMREAQAKANADPETRRKKREAAQARIAAKPEDAATFRVGHAKFHENGMPEEVKQKLREAMSGEKNANYGKTFSKETRVKMSKVHKGRTLTEEHKAAIGRGVIGKCSSRGLNRHPVHVYENGEHVASYLKLEFVAEDMGVSLKTLRNWLRAGKDFGVRRYVRDESTISVLRSK